MNSILTDKIKQYNNLKPEDLNLTDEEYEKLISFYIQSVTDWIDRYTHVKYVMYPIYPSDLELIVVLLVSRIFANQKIRQEISFMDMENYKVRGVLDSVLTEDILNQLKPFIKRSKINILTLK
jgi:hypothetical protein